MSQLHGLPAQGVGLSDTFPSLSESQACLLLWLPSEYHSAALSDLHSPEEHLLQVEIWFLGFPWPPGQLPPTQWFLGELLSPSWV